MSYEIPNHDMEKTAKNIKISEEGMKVVQEMEKIIRSNRYSILWIVYQQVQIFEGIKLNDNFMNMMYQLGIITSSTQ